MATRAPLLIALVAASIACRPRTEPAPAPAARAAYAVVGADTLYVHRFGPARDAVPRPAVLLLHGGGWTGGTPARVFPAAEAFGRAGFIALAVEYRLSDSVWTPIESLADVCTALRWTRLQADSLGVDASRVALYGLAAGGHLAASTVTVGCPEALAERGADALLLLSPAVDVANDAELTLLLRGRATARDISPVEHPREDLPPTVLVQGAADPYTTLAGAQRFCLLVVARRQQCDLRVYQGLGQALSRRLGVDDALDPDPAARADALRHQVQALVTLWRPGQRAAP